MVGISVLMQGKMTCLKKHTSYQCNKEGIDISNLDFTKHEIILGIMEDMNGFQKEKLTILQSISKIIVEYDQLIRHSLHNKKNIFLTLYAYCDLKEISHEHVTNFFVELELNQVEIKEFKEIINAIENNEEIV